jgi:dUTP pyrophosphatase
MDIQLLSENAKVPTCGTPGSAGYDLYCAAECVIPPGTNKLVSTGVAIMLPENTVGKIFPRSSLAYKKQVTVDAGVIDSDYRGEIKVLLHNYSNSPFKVEVHDRVAQLVVLKIEKHEFNIVEKLGETQRGAGGFGSTGV